MRIRWSLLPCLLCGVVTAAHARNVFQIPDAVPANGLYRPNVQTSYPGVDWQSLDVLCIPAGHYRFINLGNLPQRSAARPLDITNCGGQVRVGGLGHHYLFVLGGGANWRLTGRYSPSLNLGHADFRGHAGGGYADSAGRYGLIVDDGTVAEGDPSGISVGGGATDFEIEFVEVARVGFAGMVLKTDNNGAATMQRVRVHDTYVHDTGSEGFYIGSTQAQPQHAVVQLEFYNNRVIRTGTEIFQLGQIGGGVDVHHNVFLAGAMDWKHPFQAFQDNATQLSPRFGSIVFRNNIVIGGASTWINFLGNVLGSDSHGPADVVSLRDNYYSHSRHFGAYLGRLTAPGTSYRFERNRFRHMDFQIDQIDGAAADYDQFFRLGSGGAANTAPIVFLDNVYDGPQHFISNWSNPNQTVGNVSASGNVAAAIPPPGFVDSGFPDDFDWFRLEIWTADTATGAPVDYLVDDIVSVDGALFRCSAVAGCAAGLFPPDRADLWTALPLPPDDVRLRADSAIRDVGLLDVDDPDAVFADSFEPL